jgi:hypothetical protein
MEEALRLQAEVVSEDELLACNVLTTSSKGSICM